MSDVKTKVCINCEQEFPATLEYFPKKRDAKAKDGYRLAGRCRECMRQYNAEMKRLQRQRDKYKGVKREFV